MKRLFLLCVAILALPACERKAEEPQPQPTTSATPSSTATPAPAGGARQVSEETDTFLFEYSYPKSAGDLPDLAGWLDRDLDRLRSELATSAAQGREAASEDGFPFNKYSSNTSWEVVTDLPGWLSLSADISSYEGGAHPNYGYATMVWDKEGKRAMAPIAMFTSAAALDAVIGENLCERLNAERAKRRGAPVPEGSDALFDTCVKVTEANLLVGSRSGTHFDRIGIQIAPYLAGPYAEGSYEFSFDMTAEMLAAVKPEYHAVFKARN